MKYVAATTMFLAMISAQDAGPLDKVVKIEFPKDGYTYTLAEAAKGIKIPYTIRVAEDTPGVIAMPTGPSFQEPAGPSGLHPHESIKGQKQLYSLMDFGLAPPPEKVAKTLKKGTYRHEFDWDGRNWRGPSDTSNPKGKAFPAGVYEVEVVLQGEVKTEKGVVPYLIRGKTKLVLK
jgi:hypothetical protein